jgi:predicted TIM-barrel fold metal-dependent hydrolase
MQTSIPPVRDHTRAPAPRHVSAPTMKRRSVSGSVGGVPVWASVMAVVAVFGAQPLQGQTPPGSVTVIGPNEVCPPGMTEIRPRSCMAPEFPPPAITDYRPRSTLVTAETLVPRARFPVVDLHGHARGLGNPQTIEEMIGFLDEIGVEVYIAADNLSGEALERTLATIRASPHAHRFRVMAGIDFRDVGPGWAERAVRQLEADVAAGAIGVGEIPKSFGMTTRKPDGSRLQIDDPELAPIWEAAGRLGVPVLIHTAEPPAFFDPLTLENERWLELALFADRRNYGPGQVDFETLMTERDNLFRRHPNTTFVAAHFGWHANDLERAARHLDAFPNVYYEVGAILYELGRQPRAARDFFIRYQDRILFGKDSFQPTEYPVFWRVFETDDEYFDYYRDYHAFWKMYGMSLPDDVLRKLYHENAERLFPSIRIQPEG